MESSMTTDIGRRIVCAAMRDKELGQVILGVRHFDPIMRARVHENFEKKGTSTTWTQGFVDNKGQFLTRKEAWPIAVAAGQIIRRCGGDEGCLYSENLY